MAYVLFIPLIRAMFVDDSTTKQLNHTDLQSFVSVGALPLPVRQHSAVGVHRRKQRYLLRAPRLRDLTRVIGEQS